MPSPKPILVCQRCGHDLSDLITAPWIRTCPECGARFTTDFYYEGRPAEHPEPNILPPEAPRPGDTDDSTNAEPPR